MKQGLSVVLAKKMTRTEFLKYLGVMVVSVVGISSMLKNLAEINEPHKKVKLSSSGKRTFGSGAYGV